MPGEACQSKPLSRQWQQVLHAGCLLHTSANFRQMQACVECEMHLWIHDDDLDLMTSSSRQSLRGGGGGQLHSWRYAESLLMLSSHFCKV